MRRAVPFAGAEPLREVCAPTPDGDLSRRWFTSGDGDLYVWVDQGGAIQAFELCYRKGRDEHALRWRAGAGLDHVRVDDGEPGPRVNATPIAVADGEFDPVAVALAFEALGARLPPPLFRLVLSTLLRP